MSPVEQLERFVEFGVVLGIRNDVIGCHGAVDECCADLDPDRWEERH
jgi:hypothetical protein